MFTIKFYSGDGSRQRIFEAESFTILRAPQDATPAASPGMVDGIDAEITIHQKHGDFRIDVGHTLKPRDSHWPPVFQKAIIENAGGRTTEIIVAGPSIPRA